MGDDTGLHDSLPREQEGRRRHLHETDEDPVRTGLIHRFEEEADGVVHGERGEPLSRRLDEARRQERHREEKPVHEREATEPPLAARPRMRTSQSRGHGTHVGAGHGRHQQALGTQAVDRRQHFGRLRTPRVVGVGQGVGDPSVGAHDERRRHRQLPRLVSVEADEVDLQDLCVKLREIRRQPERESVVARDPETEIEENRELDPVLPGPGPRELSELGREGDERGSAVAELREKGLESSLLKTAIRSPSPAEEAHHHRAASKQTPEADRPTR